MLSACAVSPVQCSAVQCSAVQCSAVQRITLHSSAVLACCHLPCQQAALAWITMYQSKSETEYRMLTADMYIVVDHRSPADCGGIMTGWTLDECAG